MADNKHQIHHCRKRNACTNKRYKEKRNAPAVSTIRPERNSSGNRCGVKIKTVYEEGKNFRDEISKASASLPEGKQPTLPINEKGAANMYLAGHLIGKDVTMRHITECLTKGEEVTKEIKYAESGSRYFRLDIPEGEGMPGRFVLPSEGGPLGELVANWNQRCEFKIRHGNVVPTIKKSEIPSWLVNLESSMYVIVEKNTRQNGSLQIADGPTENDPEGDWIISTAHYGLPSRRKPRLPKERTDENMYKYLEQLDSWSDEQKRVVFVDLEEAGVDLA